MTYRCVMCGFETNDVSESYEHDCMKSSGCADGDGPGHVHTPDEHGGEFEVPWGDHVGPEIMRAHFEEKHPEITLPRDSHNSKKN